MSQKNIPKLPASFDVFFCEKALHSAGIVTEKIDRTMIITMTTIIIIN